MSERALKVYGTSKYGRSRCIVAAKSRAEAGRIFGLSDYYMKDFSSVTRNELEVAIAMRSPGIPFVRPNQPYNAPFVRMKP